MEDRITPAIYDVWNLNNSGAGSLRQAILDANASSGADTITFSGAGASGTITLTSALPTLTGDLAITGPGSTNLTLTRSGAGGLFTVNDSNDITLKTVSISGLTISSAASTGNTALTTFETVTLDDVVFANTTGEPIYVAEGSLTYSNGSMTNNARTSITARSSLFLTNVAITNNAYSGPNGAINLNFSNFPGVATASIVDSTISNNASMGINSNSSTIVEIVRTTISGNNSASVGGISHIGTSLVLRDSTVSGNTGSGISASGGGAMRILNSTISGNSVTGSNDGGGIVIAGSSTVVSLSNTTVSGNTAGRNGGGIGIIAGTLNIANSTIANNTANGASGGGGIYNGGSTAVRVINSIVSDNTAGVNANVSGTIHVSTNNLVDNASVNLQALAANGGPTQTRALGAGSSALDAGAASLTAVSAAAASGDTTLSVASSTFLQIGQFFRIGSEIVKVQTVPNATSVTVLRGQDGTTAVGHSNGAVIDLAYDQRGSGYFRKFGAAVDVGAFEDQPSGTLVPSLSGGDLVIVDGDNVANAISFVVSGANLVVTDAVELFSGTGGIPGAGLSNGSKTLTVPLASITGSNVTINSGGGNDTLTVDLSGGWFGKTIQFHGGAGGFDSLVIAGGGNQGTTTYDYVNANDGSVVMSNFGTIEYTGLEPITNTGAAADVVFNLPATTNAATLGDDGTAGNGVSRLSGATFETTDFVSPTNSLTINRGAASDTIAVNALPDFNAAFAIGTSVDPFSGVSFNGAVTLGADKNLIAFASGTISLPNAASDLATTGLGSIELTTARNIVVSSGASLTTAAGSVTLNANMQVGSTSGNFIGIDVSGGTIASVAGAVSVEGRGGSSTSNFNYGVQVNGASAQISSTSGAVLVEGTGGGTGASSSNSGVIVLSGGKIAGTGADATVTIKGFGGATSGTDGGNLGVWIGPNSQVTSNGGPVLVEGTGGGTGASSANNGVHVVGTITSAGTGAGATVTVKGFGGNTAGTGIGYNRGVYVNGNGQITSSGGAVLVEGTGGGAGGSEFNVGVSLTSGGRITSAATGAGATVTVKGFGGNTVGTGNSNYGVYITDPNSQIDSSGGAVLVEGTGGGAGASGGNFGVALLSNGTITSSGAGAGATVTVKGFGGNTTGVSNYGVYVIHVNSRIASSGGAVEIMAAGTSNSPAILLESNGALLSGGGAGLTIIADSFSTSGTVAVSSGAGTTTIKPRTAGTLINLGAADVLSGGPLSLGLSDAELDFVTADMLVVGDAASGTMTIDSAITHGNNLSLFTGGGVTANQAVTMAADKSLTANAPTIHLATGNADLTTSGTGTISLTGLASIALASGSSLTTANRPISMTGDQISIDVSGTPATISTGTGTTTLAPSSAARAIDVGGADSGSQFGLTDAELDRIAAGTIVVGNLASGTLTVSAAVDLARHLTLLSGAAVAIDAPVRLANKNLTVSAASIAAQAAITAAGGAVAFSAVEGILLQRALVTGGGDLLLNADSDANGVGALIVDLPLPELVDPNPASGNQFGHSVLVLPNGNVVVTAPFDDFGGSNAGAVYLFDGVTGAVISTLRGSSANDQIGSNVMALGNGDYVTWSSTWDNGAATNAGAVTWGSGTTGVNGVVSAANSLVGTTANDQIGGSNGVMALGNGNYVVRSLTWDNGAATDAGAVTWGNGATGISGVVSAANSLVGSKTNDQVGRSLTALASGNYVVASLFWDNGASVNAGAVTWGNGATGTSGVVSAANSLVGSTTDDLVGELVTVLSNGNYVVPNPNWDNGAIVDAGAATWGNGATGTSGVISAANSLVGSKANDRVGSYGVTALTNGNYVVRSLSWGNGAIASAGAVTWGNGATGTSGVVSAANSLVGSTANDQVGFVVTALVNGNYVVSSLLWDNGANVDAGAVTWGNGATGTSGVVSAANSLVGSTTNDQIGFGVTALGNGNYVVVSSTWDNGAIVNAGAATWGNGATGTSGVISAANSLVGSTATNQVGSSGVIELANGNYVVRSPNWDNGLATDAGAVTWGNGATGTIGVVSAANSLVGATASDQVGGFGVKALANGNYVVLSSIWDNGANANAGAATWGNGALGISGVVSAANSLVGSSANSLVGSSGVTELANGNYIVQSPNWVNGAIANAGAATWGNGATGVIGAVSAANSLVGATANDQIGSSLIALTNGNYVVRSATWDNGAIVNAGAVTWGNGATGISGVVSAANSVVGSTTSDQVGTAVTALANGNYVVQSSNWDNGAIANAGAVTWGNGATGTSGVVSAANSLVGATANDQVGGSVVNALANGNYVVMSPVWDNGAFASAGAATWANGATGTSGVVSAANSLVGLSANASLQTNLITGNVAGTFFVRFLAEGSGRIRIGSSDSASVSVDAGVGSISLAAGNIEGVLPVAPGIEVRGGAVSFAPGTALTIGIAGALADSQYQRFNVVAPVDLAGVRLVLTGAYVPTLGQSFEIVTASSLTGKFDSRAENSIFAFNGVQFRINYTATAVTLTAVASTADVYVNQAWGGMTLGQAIADADPTTAGDQPAIFGVTAFADVAGLEAVGSGKTATVFAGSYSQSATLVVPFALRVPSGTVSMSGVLSGAGGFSKVGNGTLAVSGINTFTGSIDVVSGILQVNSDSALGNAANAVAVEALGELAFTGDVASGRSFELNDGKLSVASGKTLTLTAGAEILGGIIEGPGAIATETGAGVTFDGAQLAASGTVTAGASAAFTNFVNNGTLILSAGTITLTNFENAGGGVITVSGDAEVSNFQTYGLITIASTGSFTNVGVSGLIFDGGSVTTIADGGSIDIGGYDAYVSGGSGALVTNNGSFGSATNNVVVESGGRVQGTGTFHSVVTQNGGVYSPGNSPGPAAMDAFNVNGGGTFDFEISNATGTAGHVNGWDMVLVAPTVYNPVSAQIALTATPASKYTILVTSRTNDGIGQTAGTAANFDPSQSYAWKFADGSHVATTVIGTFNPAAFNVVTSGLANSFTGAFSVELRDGGRNLYLVYSAPPTVASITAFIGPTTGGNTVVVVGANFTGATQVAFKDYVLELPNFTVNSATQITATVPSNAGTVEVVQVTVTTPVGVSSTAGTGNDYSYATPAVTSVVVGGVAVQTLGSATWASGNPLVTVASTAGLVAGAQVSSFGAGFPARATVLSVDSATTFTLSAAPTATQASATTVKFANAPKKSGTVLQLTNASWTSGSATVTVASTANLIAGQYVDSTAAGLPVDAVVANVVNGTTFTINAPAVASAAAATIDVASAAIARDQFSDLVDLSGPHAGSIVQHLVVTFNQRVTLDANAFDIVNLGTSVSTNSVLPATGDVAVAAAGIPGTGDDATGYTQYILNFVAGTATNSFSNSSTLGNAFTTLKNSLFRLNIDGAKVHAGDDTGANRSDHFWSLYGVVNTGDVFVTGTPGGGDDQLRVDGLALNDMYSTFGSSANTMAPPYNRSFDRDLDGDVDGIDLSQLYFTFGTIWTF